MMKSVTRKMANLVPALLAAVMTLACLAPAQAGGLVNGNDTGGIIPWSPQTQMDRQAIAAIHCAHYDKDARIMSVYPEYGNYISFACEFRRPAFVYPHRVVLRSRG